jgi:hypothetical protein
MISYPDPAPPATSTAVDIGPHSMANFIKPSVRLCRFQIPFYVICVMLPKFCDRIEMKRFNSLYPEFLL